MKVWLLSIKGKGKGDEGLIMRGTRRRRRPQKRSQRGRGLMDKLGKAYKTYDAYNRQKMRLPGIGGYLGAKMALKVLGPKAQKHFAPFMSNLKKVTFF